MAKWSVIAVATHRTTTRHRGLISFGRTGMVSSADGITNPVYHQFNMKGAVGPHAIRSDKARGLVYL